MTLADPLSAASHATPPTIVVGAGIIGALTALQLRRLGRPVVLMDRQSPGHGASYGNGGAISPDNCVPLSMPGMLRRIPRWFSDPLGPLVVKWSSLPGALPWLMRWVRAGRMDRVEHSARALRALHAPSLDLFEQILGHEAGSLIEKTGQLYVWKNPVASPTEALARELRERHGVETRMLDAAGIRAMDPDLAPGFQAGLFFPDNGHTVNPLRLVETIVRLFLAEGGELIEDGLEGFELEGGAVRALRCASGRRLPASHVVLALGIDAQPFAAQLGDRIPLQAERGYHVMLPQPVIRPTVKVSNRDHMFGMTPMEHGIRLAGTVEIAPPDAPFNERRAWGLLTRAKEMYPRLGTEGAQVWMGCRPSIPDSLPVIGPARKASNAIYAFGHGHTGLTGAPMTAALVAHALGLAPAPIDPAPYRPDRF